MLSAFMHTVDKDRAKFSKTHGKRRKSVISVIDVEVVAKVARVPKSTILKYCLWMLLICVSVFMASWQIQMLVKNFVTVPHYISSSYFQSEAYSIFPNVTICNFNRVNATEATRLGIENIMVEHLFFAQVATYEISSYDYLDRLDLQSESWKRYKNRTDIPDRLKDAGHLLRHLSHSCADTMRVCIFGSLKFDCCENAVSVMNGEYGACWVINAPIYTAGDTQPKQPWRGIGGGLRLVIDPGIDVYLQGVTINNYMENGILVAPNFNPYEAFYPDLAAVSPGSHARIAMGKRIRVSQAPQLEVYPRFCSDNGTLLYTRGVFDFSSCEDDCNQMQVMKECGCAQMQYKDVPTCDADQVFWCIDELTSDEWLDTSIQSDLRMCMNRCMPTCNKITDVVTVTSNVAWPGNQFKESLPEWLRDTFDVDIANNDTKKVDELILVDVYFPSTYYTMIEETEKTSLYELIGTIGGHLGLWLGVSLITFINMIGIFFKWFHSSCEVNDVFVMGSPLTPPPLEEEESQSKQQTICALFPTLWLMNLGLLAFCYQTCCHKQKIDVNATTTPVPMTVIPQSSRDTPPTSQSGSHRGKAGRKKTVDYSGMAVSTAYKNYI